MILSSIVSFIIVLSVLVFFHELGHYLAARHVDVKVERFSVGFPPRAFGRFFGETEWIVSWLPLGGYVKLWGQNLDDEDSTQPRNYAAKSRLQRAYILVAGPLMNLVLATVLMALVYMVGVQVPAYRSTPPVLVATVPDSIAATAGFQAGDRIDALNGDATPTWKALDSAMERHAMQGGLLRFDVARDDGVHTVTVDAMEMAASRQGMGWVPLVPAIAGGFPAPSAAAEGGMQKGDHILSIDGEPVGSWRDIPPRIQAGKGEPQLFVVERAGTQVQLTIAAAYDAGAERWLIGINHGSELERHGPVDSVVLGTERLVSMGAATFLFLGKMVTGQGSLDAMGGPVKIAEVVGQAAQTGFSDVLFIMAFISLQLGIFNLLPIPALDGGHLFMLGIEGTLRSDISAKVREKAQMVGLSLLLVLILVVTLNDVRNLFG